MKRISLALLAAAASTSIACGPPPKVLVHQEFFPPALGEDKIAQESMQLSGQSTDKQRLFNYSIRICDVNPQGVAKPTCKETLILENVSPKTIY
jgi:hypothetical protein